jgi:hypothetical protein
MSQGPTIARPIPSENSDIQKRIRLRQKTCARAAAEKANSQLLEITLINVR